MNTGILVFIEQRSGEMQKVSLELLGKARVLADEKQEKVIAAIAGNKVEKLASECFHYGADKVVIVDDSMLDLYHTEGYARAISGIINEVQPEICLFGATAIGRDLAPRIAARIETGLTADCTSLEIDEETGKLLMTRPAFGGNILATIICPDHLPQMSTVRPGVMQMMEVDTSRDGEVIKLSVDLADSFDKVEIVEVAKSIKKLKKIEEANVLVSGGRGIGSKENFAVLQDLANELGGMISGSRAVVDAGWIEQDSQVGQTGKTVRPDLYIACGISGAIQHLAGMEDSELIIAINKDPNAPIFQVAGVGIAGDAVKVIPKLIETLKAAKSEEIA